MSSSWYQRVIISPHVLQISKDGTGSLHLLNNGSVRLAYKLKCTRSHSLKPTGSTGFLSANGGCKRIEFVYKPKTDEKPFNATDHVTVLFAAAPEGIMNWESCGGASDDKKCHRVVVKIEEMPTDAETDEDDEKD